jgi:hypothetical protein
MTGMERRYSGSQELPDKEGQSERGSAHGFDFDRLAKELAGGLSRRAALRRLGEGLAATLLASLGLHRAWGQGNSNGAQFCTSVYPPGPARGQCISDAAHGRGLCYECGPASTTGQQVCGVSTGRPFCCPSGQECSDGICCPPGLSNSDGTCCPIGWSNSNGICCPQGLVNTGGICCPDGDYNAAGICCPIGLVNTGGICCPEGDYNANGICCPIGLVNIGGTCLPT